MLTDIIRATRLGIYDKDGSRWTEEDILLYINEALGIISTQARIFKSSYTIQIDKEEDYLPLPDNLIETSRVEVNGCVIPEYSTYNLECGNCKLPSMGMPKYWVQGEGRTSLSLVPKGRFPIVTTKVDMLSAPVYGVATDIPNIKSEAYGILGVGYGVTTGIEGNISLPTPMEVTVHYIQSHPRVTLDSKLLLSEGYTSMLSDYAIYKLLLIDRDTVSENIGDRHLRDFNSKLDRLKRDRTTNFSSSLYHEVPYRRY